MSSVPTTQQSGLKPQEFTGTEWKRPLTIQCKSSGLPYMEEEPNIAETLAYIADRRELFSRKEMAVAMKEAAQAIRDLRLLVGIREEIEPEECRVEGEFITLPSSVRVALDRFKDDQPGTTYGETIETALRDFLIGHGYLKIEEIDEETVTEGSA